MIDLILELAKAAVEFQFEEQSERPGAIGCYGLRDCFRDVLAELNDGIPPGSLELDEYCRDFIPDPKLLCYLCDAETRLPLDGVPLVSLAQQDCMDDDDQLKARGLIWIDVLTYKVEEAAREAARKAEWAAECERNRTHLNAEERDALVAYAKANGRMWKRRLRTAWENASESDILQRLRNASYFGPAGLEKYKLPKYARATA